MKARLAIVAILVFVLSFEVSYAVFANIPSWENSKLTFQVDGTPGTQFEAFFTHEVKYIIGSRTEETDIQSEITDKVFQFNMMGIEISANITCKTPGRNITFTVLHGGVTLGSQEGPAFYFTFAGN